MSRLRRRKGLEEFLSSAEHSCKRQPARSSLLWVIPIVGFLSFVWFLLRVVPKPSRATYPCQRAAMPLASAFVLWVIGAVGSGLACRRARELLRRSRWGMGAVCLLLAVAAALVAVLPTQERPLLADPPTANAPIGTPRGIHPGRVVWVHDPRATSWGGTNDLGEDIGDGYWWQSSHTDQTVVDRMMAKAIKGLAGQSSEANAWQAIFQHFNQTRGKGTIPYQAGEKISIKPNLVTAWRSYPDIVDASGNQTHYLGWVNTSPQMILALLRQLVNVVGVAQSDITVGDTTTYFPNHYWNVCHGEFPNVHYLACSGAWSREQALSSQGLPCESRMHWSTPGADGSQPDYLPVNYAQADYLINFACLKGHSSGITLCAKNHYGSFIRLPDAQGFYNLHLSLPNGWWSPGSGHYRALVDIMGRQDLGQKTVLYLIDGLYGGYMSNGRPYLWQMTPFCGDWPSSLFASHDPVAIDSVGYDFMLNEWPHIVAAPGLQGGADDYLHEAALADDPPSQTTYQPDGAGHPLTSLGVHEHWNNPLDKQYSVNLGQGPGIELMHIGLQVGDSDGDGDVDQSDFGHLQACLSGAGVPQNNATCQDAKLDPDSDVDSSDVAIFRRCLSGAGIPADPSCAN